MTRKTLFELTIIIGVLFLAGHYILYYTYFDSFCDKYSGKDEQNFRWAITKLASCKDSVICEPLSIQANIRNEVTDWSCIKKESDIVTIQLTNYFRDMSSNLWKE